MSDLRFENRSEAGRRLAEKLGALKGHDVVVLGLPRGGVPVAYEVARALDAPLDVIVVRKLGVPYQPEVGMGAIGEDGARVINPDIVRSAGVSSSELAEVEAAERAELARRAERFRAGRRRIALAGRIALLVDDGIATGSTAKAACEVARQQGANLVVMATPVAPVGVARTLADSVDELIVLESPASFLGVGQFYADFTQTADEDVVALLDRAAARSAEPATDDDRD